VPRDALTRRGEQADLQCVVARQSSLKWNLIADMGEKMAISNEQLK